MLIGIVACLCLIGAIAGTFLLTCRVARESCRVVPSSVYGLVTGGSRAPWLVVPYHCISSFEP